MQNKKRAIKMLLFIFIFITMTMPCRANSAEPPSLAVIVTNAPQELVLAVDSGNGLREAYKRGTAWETYYLFYSRDMAEGREVTLSVTSGQESFNININKSLLRSHQNIVTLNLSGRTVTPGKLFFRSFILVFLRLILTLMIESIVFFLFCYRKRESWLAFLTINFITQGVLNMWLNGFSPFTSYLIFSLIFAEFFVFIAEIILFLVFVKEHGNFRKVCYVLAANFISLVLGGCLITLLPV